MNTEILWNDGREWAKAPYLHQGKTIREIAGTVGADESTLLNWINEGLWEERKRNMLTSKKAQPERYYLLFEDLNSMLKSENGEPNTRIINAIMKLTTAICKLENDDNISNTLEVAEAFTSWLLSRDLEFAKKVTVHLDLFIKEKLRHKFHYNFFEIEE